MPQRYVNLFKLHYKKAFFFNHQAAMAIQENGPSCRAPIPLLRAWQLL